MPKTTKTSKTPQPRTRRDDNPIIHYQIVSGPKRQQLFRENERCRNSRGEMQFHVGFVIKHHGHEQYCHACVTRVEPKSYNTILIGGEIECEHTSDTQLTRHRFTGKFFAHSGTGTMRIYVAPASATRKNPNKSSEP